MALANIVKNSLGPQGLDKMLVDDLGGKSYINCCNLLINFLLPL